MTTSLAGRLEEIPGVAAVSVDLTTDTGDAIVVQLAPDADQEGLLERLREVLAAYGIRPRVDPIRRPAQLGVDVLIEPVKGGARIEVRGDAVSVFRIVAPEPLAIAQGLVDAWCRVLGRIPLEVTRVGIDRRGNLEVRATDGTAETSGSAEVGRGWARALTLAVGEAIGVVQGPGQAAGDW